MQDPTIITIEPIILVGMEIESTIAPGPNIAMWRSFMPRRHEIPHRLDAHQYSVQLFPLGFRMADFCPETVFRRRAAVAVSEFEDIPEGMSAFLQPGGWYAQFIYRGLHRDYPGFSRWIFMEWLPGSGYELDDRPHFQVMTEKYLGPENPDSEEEVWVPLRRGSGNGPGGSMDLLVSRH